MNNASNMLPVEKQFKKWVYGLFVEDGVATTSDGTKYRVDPISGSYTRITKKAKFSQRERRRLMGKIRRSAGMTRSQFDKVNNIAV